MLHVIRVLACILQEFSTIPKAEVKNMNAFFEAISKQKYEGKKMVIANYDDEDDDDDKSDDKSDDDRHIKNRLQVPLSTSRRRVLHALSDGGVTSAAKAQTDLSDSSVNNAQADNGKKGNCCTWERTGDWGGATRFAGF